MKLCKKILSGKRTVENSKNDIYNMHKKKKRFKNNQQNVWRICKSYQHTKVPKKGKNRVIHEVIHVIHKKISKKRGLHSKKIEHPFCEKLIKFLFF